VINPLRSEREAFRFLVWFLVIFGAIVALILIGRAIF
jgi:hypothetical protein